MAKNKEVRKVAIIGTGVIGASWAALYLAHGLDVVATDIARATARLRNSNANATLCFWSCCPRARKVKRLRKWPQPSAAGFSLETNEIQRASWLRHA
jgi:3-hydroxyacyl-CoA dehydrogenase